MPGARRPVLFGIPILVGVILLVFAIARIGAGEADESDDDELDNDLRVEQVSIESVEVEIAESFPVQIFVVAQGYVPDPCWMPREPVVEQEGNRFRIEILAERDPEDVCAQVIEPYSENIALGQAEPGEYVVDVNGVEQEFRVD